MLPSPPRLRQHVLAMMIEGMIVAGDKGAVELHATWQGEGVSTPGIASCSSYQMRLGRGDCGRWLLTPGQEVRLPELSDKVAAITLTWMPRMTSP